PGADARPARMAGRGAADLPVEMKQRPAFLAVGLGLLVAGGWTERCRAQALVPLGDEVETALLPAGITNADVEMFGELVHLWKDPAGTDVIHFIGDFELHVGARRMAAREAVIWLTPRTFERSD